MFMRRRRPLMRAAMVGGAAYYAGRKVQEGREQDEMTEARLDELEAQQAAPPRSVGGISDSTIQQLKQLGDLKDAGILTVDEFEEQKRKLLQVS
jgi:Short C-terminal domain